VSGKSGSGVSTTPRIVAAYGAELDREYLKNWANRLGLDLGLGNEGGANTDRKEKL
jgi:hypothetical protein